MVSVIIPSRDDRYLNPTIQDILAKASGDIEIIVVLDGHWPDPMIVEDKRVIIVHHGELYANKGMRESINVGVAISRGEYLLKADEHTMWDQGWDQKLIADYQEGDVVIPRRYRLNPDTWTNISDGRKPIDYMSISFPYQRPKDKTCGLHGEEWKRPERVDILIDETPSMQGSAYFMSRKHWNNVIKFLDSENYGYFQMEAQELGFKTWFSGGRVMVNKKTWYSHVHKGTFRGKGYGFSRTQYHRHAEEAEKGRIYARDYWLNTKDFKYDWEWFINHFPTMPGWGSDWKNDIIRCQELEK